MMMLMMVMVMIVMMMVVVIHSHRLDNVMAAERKKLFGSMPKSREDFHPEELLNKMDGGEDIIVMDSRKDLPADWRNIDFMERWVVVLSVVVCVVDFSQ